MKERNAYGGAVYTGSGAEFINCLFDSNAAIGGIDIDSDECCSDTYGGAVWADPKYWDGSSWEGGKNVFKNCTFVDNYVESKESDRSVYGAAISAGWDKDKKIYMLNTIIWGGRAIRGGSDWTGIDQDRLNVDIESGSNHKFIVNYSNIQNSTGTAHDDDNIYDVPPVFKDADSDDFSLDDASPLIGAGIASWTSESITAPTKDILKTTRGTVPDIGAYEHSLDASTAPLPLQGLQGSLLPAAPNSSGLLMMPL